MIVIIITIITQGARIPSDHRGALVGHILISDGVAQAIGVISFGNFPHAYPLSAILTSCSICVP